MFKIVHIVSYQRFERSKDFMCRIKYSRWDENTKFNQIRNNNIIVVGFFQAMWNLKANANTWKMHEKKEKQTDEWSVLFYSFLRVLNTHIPFLKWHARKKKQTRTSIKSIVNFSEILGFNTPSFYEIIHNFESVN